jgi:hypothetical protein
MAVTGFGDTIADATFDRAKGVPQWQVRVRSWNTARRARHAGVSLHALLTAGQREGSHSHA